MSDKARIQPTPGRVVWYRPAAGESMATSGDDPLAANVAGCNADGTVNLAVFDAVGCQFSRCHVPLIQPGEPAPDGYDRSHCHWMPYQIGQARQQS